MPAPPLFGLQRGESRLLVSVPHAGTFLPPDIAARLNPAGRALADTDWHVDRLVAFAAEAGATLLVASHSRHVVDLNRAPSGDRLYPGQAETTICPTESFSGAALYDGAAPDQAEIARRVAAYWQPYHTTLAAELARLHALHGQAVLLDMHSIRAHVPRLFPGRLPDLNFGTNSGAACTPDLAARAMRAAQGHGFSQVLDARFRGGHITRHYGQPAHAIQAIQLEMAQAIYMDENHTDSDGPPNFDAARAAVLQTALRAIVRELLAA